MTPRRRPHPRRPARPAIALLLAGLVALGGCAAGRRGADAGPLGEEGPKLAVIPLENISERTDAAEVTTRIVAERVTEVGGWKLIERADVDAALEQLGVRESGSLSAARLKELGTQLGVGYLLTGSVLENGMIRTGDGDIPAVGLSLELVQVDSGRVVWRRLKFRTGDDHETIFGWGRVRSAQKLTAELVGEMLAEMPSAPPVGAAGGEGEK